MILLDTCTVIYALDARSPFNAWAVQAIIDANKSGQACVNPIIVAEVASGADNPDLVTSELSNFGIQLTDLPMAAAVLAGKAYALFSDRWKQEGRQAPKTPLPDFFIGAHAETLGWSIVTNDPGRFKVYYPGVKRIEP